MRKNNLLRINKVFKYIDQNLDEDLSLETLSNIAHISPFHFHRIFKYITGETLNEYVVRQRVEKSASLLIHQKEKSITELSLENGFTNNSSFTRTFKKFYGVNPTEFRNQNSNKISKIGQAPGNFEKYICVVENLKTWIQMNSKIKVKKVEEISIAFLTCIGTQNLESGYGQLIQWATTKNLMGPNAKLLTIFHDSLKVTPAHRARMSAGIITPELMQPDGEIDITTIAEGKCIVGSYEITLNEFEKAWTGLFLWMNENGYQKADQDPFEIYHNDFKEHPEQKCIVDLYIPVE